MGSPLGPVLANLSMVFHGKKLAEGILSRRSDFIYKICRWHNLIFLFVRAMQKYFFFTSALDIKAIDLFFKRNNIRNICLEVLIAKEETGVQTSVYGKKSLNKFIY